MRRLADAGVRDGFFFNIVLRPYPSFVSTEDPAHFLRL